MKPYLYKMIFPASVLFLRPSVAKMTDSSQISTSTCQDSSPLQPKEEENQSPPSAVHHHQSDAPPCRSCGSPITPPPSFPEISPPPHYRPIRTPALPIHPSHNSQSIILSPVPQPQPVSTVHPPYHFQIPIKKIQSPSDALHFTSSPTGSNFIGFVAALSQAVRGRKLSDPISPISPVVDSLVSLLQTLIANVDSIPPAPQTSRYGNLSFRTWHIRLSESAETLTLKLLPEPLSGATIELAPYLLDSFGNPSRIDYGTGHETNFAAFLYCLARICVISEEDYPAIVLHVFAKYLELMRKLQDVYCLEPAGSHGVWGLDDYHFLPFIFGSSQLIDHKYMKPKSIHNQDILDNFSKEYMYLSCVAYVKKVKKGVFAEHSPLLDDISGVPNWNKVNSGLLKMYKAEVLEKVPIMQHFLFGWLIKWE